LCRDTRSCRPYGLGTCVVLRTQRLRAGLTNLAASRPKADPSQSNVCRDDKEQLPFQCFQAFDFAEDGACFDFERSALAIVISV
jgi:hypothetical protein